MSVKLTGALPKTNGLDVIADELVAFPHHRHIVVAVVDCDRIITDTDTEESVPVARIRRIEVIRDHDTDETTAYELIRAANDRRNGVEALPLDEDDIQVDQDGVIADLEPALDEEPQ